MHDGHRDGPRNIPFLAHGSSFEPQDHLRAHDVECETYRVFCSAIVIMSLFTVIPQGPFVSQATENNCPYRRVVGF